MDHCPASGDGCRQGDAGCCPSQTTPDPKDQNSYTLGSVHGHNVVIACLPSGVYGTTSAAIVAVQMLFTFRAIRFGLLVGIGGGAPSREADIRLGDVVVSKPTENCGGVIQYDYGKTINDGYFQLTGTLNKPPQVLLTAISHLQAQEMLGTSQLSMFLSRCVSKYPTMSPFTDCGQKCDQLYEAEYDHAGPANTCCDCDQDKLVVRPSRATRDPRIHYGLIASANQVMKHGITRDRLARELHVLCFEMEAAGLMDHFPCLVIRGVCDYADSHKNKQWQPYAAATAAAYTSELLSVIPTSIVLKTITVSDAFLMAIAGFAASATVFLDVSSRILARLLEPNSPTKNTPDVLKQIKIQLPLMVEIMKQIEKDWRDSRVAGEAQDALLPVVNSSLQQVNLLDKLIQETLPTPEDSRLRRARKAIASLRNEKIMFAAIRSLEGYKSTLTLYLGQKSRTETAALCKSEEMHAEMAAMQRENMKLKCERWLKPSGIRSIPQPHLPGTCEWIWTEQEFTEWSKPSSDSSQLLCVYGVHGCGKSVLAAYIARRLRDMEQPVLFFSFSSLDDNRKTLDSLVRLLLWQLLEETFDQNVIDIVDDLMHRGPITTSELFEALLKIAKLNAGLVYCIIDGVDECTDESNDPDRGLLKAVLDLIKHTNLHVALLGRPYALQAAIHASPSKIEMNSRLTRPDIEEFIRTEIQSSWAHWTQELRDIVFKELREKSDGMFLWVKLMIDELRKSATRREVMDRLQNMPRGLKGLFRVLFLRLVEELDEFELALARRALAFTITSCRTLTVDELRYCYALDTGSASTLEDHLLLQPEKRIMDVCGGLVNITGGHVHLIHTSVKEFLTRPEEEWSDNEDQKIKHFRVNLEATHRCLASVCIDYLGEGEYGCFLDGTDSFFDLETQYPFLSYASRYAISHLIQSGPPEPLILGKINDFLESHRSAVWIEYLVILLVDDDWLNVTFENETPIFVSWLFEEDNARKLFESRVRMIWSQELARRIENFGEDDPRTERWRAFLDVLEDSDPNKDSPDPAVASDESPTSSSQAILQMRNLISSHAVLPLPRQLDMIMKLGSHLRRVHILSDSLKLLFEMILKTAKKLPIPVFLIIGNFYIGLGKLEDALTIYYTALARTENQERPIRFIILHEIGYVLGKQNKYLQAEEMYRQALEGQERVLGKEHPDTLTSINDLGCALHYQGKYAEAEQMHRQALDGRERVLGKEHPDTLTSINDLGCALHYQGKYAEAKQMHRQALDGRERVLGKEHPDTLTSINNLGLALRFQGKNAEAEQMHRQALDGRERVLGKEHPDTFTSINNLGCVIYRQGKYAEAEQMHRQALEGQERVLGNKHPDTLTSIRNLGWALHKQGKHVEAADMFQRAERND